MQEALARMRAKNGGGGVGGKGKAEGGVHGKAGSGSSMEPHAAGRPTTSHSNNRMQAVSAAAPAVKGPSTTGSIKHRPQGSSTKQQGPSKHLPHNKYNDDDDQGDWRAALRAVTGYDPGRYRDAGNDRMMEASVQDIMREERRSAVLGKQADMYVAMFGGVGGVCVGCSYGDVWCCMKMAAAVVMVFRATIIACVDQIFIPNFQP